MGSAAFSGIVYSIVYVRVSIDCSMAEAHHTSPTEGVNEEVETSTYDQFELAG